MNSAVGKMPLGFAPSTALRAGFAGQPRRLLLHELIAGRTAASVTIRAWATACVRACNMRGTHVASHNYSCNPDKTAGA